jgi:hypothetical protein
MSSGGLAEPWRDLNCVPTDPASDGTAGRTRASQAGAQAIDQLRGARAPGADVALIEASWTARQRARVLALQVAALLRLAMFGLPRSMV